MKIPVRTGVRTNIYRRCDGNSCGKDGRRAVRLERSFEWIFEHSLSAVVLPKVIIWLFESSSGSVQFQNKIDAFWALFSESGFSSDPAATFAVLALATAIVHEADRWGARRKLLLALQQRCVEGSDTMR